MNDSIPATHIRWPRAFLVGAAIALAGCSTTGNKFDTTGLGALVPGETTFAQASELLQGAPVNIYRQLDGSATARWAHTSTVLTDAIYFNQEVWLAFDPYGRYLHVVKSHNVPTSHFEKAPEPAHGEEVLDVVPLGEREPVTVVAAAAPATSPAPVTASASPETTPVPASATSFPVQPPGTEGPSFKPTVSYRLNQ